MGILILSTEWLNNVLSAEPAFSGYMTHGLFLSVLLYGIEPVFEIRQQVIDMLNAH